MAKIPTNRAPIHPGEMLLFEFLEPNGITQKKLAEEIKVPFQRVNELVNQKRGVTPSTALRLSKFFGNSPEFWLNLQQHWDIYRTIQKESEVLDQIKCYA